MILEAKQIYEIMGAIGSFIMCVSAIPQIIKTYRTKCTKGLSGSYLAALMTGMIMILIYSLSVNDAVFIFGNTLALLLTGILMGLWIRYRIE